MSDPNVPTGPPAYLGAPAVSQYPEFGGITPPEVMAAAPQTVTPDRTRFLQTGKGRLTAAVIAFGAVGGVAAVAYETPTSLNAQRASANSLFQAGGSSSTAGNSLTSTTEALAKIGDVCPDGVFPNGTFEASEANNKVLPDDLHWHPSHGKTLETKQDVVNFFFGTGDQTACRSAATLGTLTYLSAYIDGFSKLGSRGIDTTVSLPDMVRHLTTAKKEVQERTAVVTQEMVSRVELNKDPETGKWLKFTSIAATNPDGTPLIGQDGKPVYEVGTQEVDFSNAPIAAESVWMVTAGIDSDSLTTGGVNHRFFVDKVTGQIYAANDFGPRNTETTTSTSTTTSTTTTTTPAQVTPNRKARRLARFKPDHHSRITIPVKPINNGTIPAGGGSGTGTGTGTGTGGSGSGSGGTGSGTGGSGGGGGGGGSTPSTTAAPHKGPEVTIPGAPN